MSGAVSTKNPAVPVGDTSTAEEAWHASCFVSGQEGRDVLGYALTFLALALIAGLLGLSGIAGAAANIVWSVLVALFIATLAVAVGRALSRIAPF